MAEEKTVTEDKNYKPSFDGRLKYFDALKVWLLTFGQAQQSGDINGVINSIEGILFMTAPFVKNEDFEKVAQQITTVRQLFYVAKRNNGMRFLFEKNFFELKKTIFQITRHMWVSVKGEDATELDMQQFFGESDL